MIEIISSNQASAPNGHYSQAIKAGSFIFLAGQIGKAPDSQTIPDKLEDEFLNAMTNVFSIIKAAGGSSDMIVKITIYIDDIKNWERINDLYSKAMGEHRPARSVIPVGKMHLGARILLDVVAYIES